MGLSTENPHRCNEVEVEVEDLFLRLLAVDRNSGEFDRLFQEFDQQVAHLMGQAHGCLTD